MSGTRRLTAATRRLSGDPLVANSVHLILNTALMAAFGVAFWLVCARLYSPEDVGKGTALISASGFIGLASLMGFNNSFVRFLPTSQRRDSHLNSGLLIVAAVSAALAVAYLALIPTITPALHGLRSSPWAASAFVVMCVALSLNTLTDSVFVAYRAARYNLLLDGGVQSLTKLLCVVLLSGLGAFGIFGAVGVGGLVAVTGSIMVLRRRFGYTPQLRLDYAVLRQIAAFTSGNYVAYLLNISPALLIPVLVIGRIGTAAAGYFYLAFMVANVVFSAVYAVTNSTFAETSHEQETVLAVLRRAVVLLAIVILPASLALALLAPSIMLAFGADYSAQAAGALAVLGLSAPLVGAYDLGTVTLRAQRRVLEYILVNVVYAATVLGLSLAWAGSGLMGIAWAWLLGNGCAAAACGGLLVARRQVHPLGKVPEQTEQTGPTGAGEPTAAATGTGGAL